MGFETLFLGVLSISSLAGIGIVFSGWSSSSSFSSLGSFRRMRQFLSFEVVFSFIWLFLLWSLFSGISTVFFHSSIFLKCIFFLWILGFLLSLLSETQRAPFDLPEGESELVSGFNTEFSSILFSILFLREYNLLLFFLGVLCVMWRGKFM